MAIVSTMCSRLILLLVLLSGCFNKTASLKIKGSDTEVNLVSQIAENYHKNHKDRYISISGGGSGLGIASLMNGQADIANSSRELNESEKQMFRDRGIALDTFVFAEDAIAFVVSKKRKVDSLRVDQLADILSGKISNWSAVNGENLPMNIYGRQSNSGTYDFVKQILNIAFSRDAKEMNGNAQILEALKADESGIGYVGAGYVMNLQSDENSPLKVLLIAEPGKLAYSPLDSAAVFQHHYFFRRHLYQYILSSSRDAATGFIEYEKSPEGDALIKKAGYYPLKK